MGDQVVVLKDGILRQVDSPLGRCDRPTNLSAPGLVVVQHHGPTTHHDARQVARHRGMRCSVKHDVNPHQGWQNGPNLPGAGIGRRLADPFR